MAWKATWARCVVAQVARSAYIAPRIANVHLGTQRTGTNAKLLLKPGLVKVVSQVSRNAFHNFLTSMLTFVGVGFGAVDQLGPHQTTFCFWQMKNDSIRHLESRSSDDLLEDERVSRERHAGILVMKIDYRVLPFRVSYPPLEQCRIEDENASPLNGLTGNVVVESLFSCSVTQEKEWDVWLSGNHGRYGRLVYGIFPHPKARRFSALCFFPEPRTLE